MNLYNASSGLPLGGKNAEVCFFQSCHAHNLKCGYFADNAMPWNAVIELLKGGILNIVDGSRNKSGYVMGNRRCGKLSDALTYGVPTWMMVFNQAIQKIPARRTCADYLWDEFEWYNPLDIKVCEWQTRHMIRATFKHDKLRHQIRRLAKVYGRKGPAIVGRNVMLTTHRATWDDKPEEMKRRMI